MQWLKIWLMKWLGVEEIHAENAELIQRLDVIQSSLEVKSKSDLAALRADLIDAVKVSDVQAKKISELESVVKDATLDTVVLDLEDRVAKLESAPVPATQQGRRGGSAWGAHQVAAAAGAALANGSPVPIPIPGIS